MVQPTDGSDESDVPDASTPQHQEAKHAPDDVSYSTRRWAGVVGGPIAFVAFLLLPVPEGLEPAGWRAAAIGLLMAIWWVTEAIPIPATALLPVVLFPLFGVSSIEEATTPYANPLIFLFLGGFLIAIAMQRWELHRRIALRIIYIVGTEPRALIAGFMIAGAFLSMWISNTATAMMMLPIGLSIIQLARSEARVSDGRIEAFAIALMLSIAYACNIGGIGTLIGTPPNALLAGFLDESYGIDIGFAEWMLMGLPVVLMGLPLTYVLLTHWLFPLGTFSLASGRHFVRRELDQLGALNKPERMVAIVFGSVALLWMTRPLFEPVVPGLSDAGIAMIGGVALFLLPVDMRTGTFVLDWRATKDLPWDVLILFGGGLLAYHGIGGHRHRGEPLPAHCARGVGHEQCFHAAGSHAPERNRLWKRGDHHSTHGASRRLRQPALCTADYDCRISAYAPRLRRGVWRRPRMDRGVIGERRAPSRSSTALIGRPIRPRTVPVEKPPHVARDKACRTMSAGASGFKWRVANSEWRIEGAPAVSPIPLVRYSAVAPPCIGASFRRSFTSSTAESPT